MKLSVLVGLMLVFGVACGPKEEKQGASNPPTAPHFRSAVTSFASASDSTRLYLFADSTCMLVHKVASMQYTEIGRMWEREPGVMMMNQAVDMEELVQVEYDYAPSDSLVVQLLYATETVPHPSVHLVLFDSLVIPFIEDRVVLDKRHLFNNFPVMVNYEDFDKALLYKMLIYAGDQYMAFFESDVARSVKVHIPSQEELVPLGTPVTFLRMRTVQQALVLEASGHPNISFDTLFHGNP